jgi:putative ABC transport system permease protein
MFSLYRTLSWRYYRKHWLRTLLVIASIALGVATLVATRALNQSMNLAGREAVSPLAGLADLHVDNGEAWVRRDLCDRLRTIPGVRLAEPIIIERVLLPDLGNRSVMLLGVGVNERLARPDELVRDNPWGVDIRQTRQRDLSLVWELATGRKPALVGKELAAELGSKFRILAAGSPRSILEIGTVEAKGAAAALNRSLIVLDVAHAAELLDQPTDLVTRIDLFLEEGADREQVRQTVTDAVAGQAVVRTREMQGQSLSEVMAGLELGFTLSGAGALVVGLFLVYNALSVSGAERRHDIGILRSLGATRGQVARLFAGEAVLLGLAGSLLGVPLGIGLASLTLGPIAKTLSDILIPMEATQVVVTPATLVAAVLAGAATALLAALVPSLEAAFGQPADAVRRGPTAAGLPLRLCLLGLLLLAAGLAGFAFRMHMPARVGLFGGVAVALLGCFLMLPLCAAVLAQLVQPLARRFGSIEVRLAADNLVRTPGRTGLVIAALAAAVTLTLQTAGVTYSNERPIMDWIDQTLTADVYVSGGGPLSAPNQNVAVHEKLGDEMEHLPGVEKVLPTRFRRPDFRGTVVFLTALDAQTYHDLNRRRGRAVPEMHLFPLLTEPGTALISENFRSLHNVDVGDTITLGGPDGPVELRVVGVLLDYSWNRGSVIVDRQTYRNLFRDSRVDVFDIYFQAGSNPAEVQKRLEDWGARQAMFVTTRSQVYDWLRDAVRNIYSIAYLQQIVVAIVAALGVVTALLISVLQRQRELGLLRAVGATRGQVLRSVRAEATLMGLIGTLIGVLIGVPFEWYVLKVVIWEESGFNFPVLIPWLEAAMIAGIALVTATLAGLVPALQAVRLRIAEAIAYE